MLAKLYTDLVRVARGGAAASCVVDPVDLPRVFPCVCQKVLAMETDMVTCSAGGCVIKDFHKKCTAMP